MLFLKATSHSAGRRQMLGRLGSLGLLALAGGSANGAAASGGSDAGAAGTCMLTPDETEGPFPLLAVLRNPAMVRRDIREGKAGVPLTLVLNLQNVRNSCAPLSHAAAYIWHCDKDGAYSGYRSPGVGHQGETFLRGVQLSDANGQVRFVTIYPGWYPGRITHIHFQIYLNDNLRAPATFTSQLTFPEKVTAAVYDNRLYTRGQNASVKHIADDDVFSDGAAHQTVTMSGDTERGYVATLNVGLRV